MKAQELLNSYINKLTPETHSNAPDGSWGNEDYEDYRVVKGVQEALMSNELSGAQLDQLILNGSFTPKQVFLLGDIHNFGAHTDGIYKDPRFQEIVKETREQNKIRRQELGVE
tara:strand:+ start:781 stop:1119 length:339 start_codon:yes stop_codon:yes gene_type:complete